MFVLSMNSKRQRRPNVRLGEIGDVSAAFACGFSHKAKENLGNNIWGPDFVNPKENELNIISGFSEQKSSQFLVSDPAVSHWFSADLQQNRENKNPNSTKLGSEFVSSDQIDMTKPRLNFGTITRKSRIMKRRGRSTVGKSSVFGSAWSSKLSPQVTSEDGKESGGKDLVGFTSNVCGDYQAVNAFKDFSDHETPATSKEACEYDLDETACDVWRQGNGNDYWKDFSYEGNNAFLKFGDGSDEMRFGGTDVNSVRRWLEDLGFGKYADIFEMHEVDEETLPLITLEDLKEMGIFAVGPRRKLYTAIQQLRGEDASS